MERSLQQLVAVVKLEQQFLQQSDHVVVDLRNQSMSDAEVAKLIQYRSSESFELRNPLQNLQAGDLGNR